MPKPESQIPDNHILPDSQLEKRTRRRFSTKYKLRILAEADQCAYGELGPLLRRENLYSNQLRDWRKQLEVGGEAALSKSAPGPKASKTPDQKRIEQLEKELTKTQHRLRVTEDCVDLQKSLVDARSVEQWERSIMTVLEARPAHIPFRSACDALGLNRSTVYAWRRRQSTAPDPVRRSRKTTPQPRALLTSERVQILERMNEPEFCDQTPYQVYHTLLERGECLASLSTLYRVLRQANQTGDRRNQRAPQSHAIPRLTATRPNEVWTWDITKLATTRRGNYLNLYVVMDLFSRYVVAWMISRKENSQLAQQLMEQTLTRYGLTNRGVTLHQDRGSPMIAQSFLDLMADVGVVCSHSRPRVSNDNPFSESQFKTLKTQPDFPGRFDSLEYARLWAADYFCWYNHEHHHSGLAGFTPTQVYTGNYQTVGQVRQATLDRYYRDHPERFCQGKPKAALPPEVVHINPITSEAIGGETSSAVNFPTLPAARKALERANRC